MDPAGSRTAPVPRAPAGSTMICGAAFTSIEWTGVSRQDAALPRLTRVLLQELSTEHDSLQTTLRSGFLMSTRFSTAFPKRSPTFPKRDVNTVLLQERTIQHERFSTESVPQTSSTSAYNDSRMVGYAHSDPPSSQYEDTGLRTTNPLQMEA